MVFLPVLIGWALPLFQTPFEHANQKCVVCKKYLNFWFLVYRSIMIWEKFYTSFICKKLIIYCSTRADFICIYKNFISFWYLLLVLSYIIITSYKIFHSYSSLKIKLHSNNLKLLLAVKKSFAWGMLCSMK